MSSGGLSGHTMFFSHLSYMARFLEKKGVLKIKMHILISLQILSEIFLNLRRIQRDITINVHRASRKLPIILVRFLIKSEFSCQIFFKNTQVSNFMKIRPQEAELYVERQKRQSNCHLSQFCKCSVFGFCLLHACSVWGQFLFEKAPVCPAYQQMLNENSQVL